MPNPGSLYQRKDLAGLSAGRARQVYVANRVAPEYFVSKQTGIILQSDPNNRRLRVLNTVRAPGQRAVVFENADPSTAYFNCVDHAERGHVSTEESSQAENAAVAELTNTNDMTDSVMLRKEVDLVALCNAMTYKGTPDILWDVLDTADAVADLKELFGPIARRIGKDPNALVIPSHVLRMVGEQAKFKARFQNGTALQDYAKLGDAAKLAMLINIPVENIDVPDNWKNDNPQGIASDLNRIWGQNVLLYYRDVPRQRSQGLAQTYVWGASGSVDAPSGSGRPGNVRGWTVAEEPVLDPDGKNMYVHYDYDQQFLNAGAGYFLADVQAEEE